MSKRFQAWPGKPYPLGATWKGQGVNFALFSAHAEKVELCLFNASGRNEIRLQLRENTHQIWHGYVPEVRPGQRYGYRVYGPYEPHLGHRFNHHKLLLDPYARQLTDTLRWTDAHYGYRIAASQQDLSFDRRDSARHMPKCVVIDPAFTWHQDHPPEIPWSQTIIYETHLRGFTIRHEGIPKNLRGTFAGMTQPEIVDYLKALGITSIELLPIHAYADERFLIDRGLYNYWGYNSLSYFAPQPRYLGSGELYEFKSMVRRLHDAGIEVLLDVVYNHTAEGDHRGPTLSFRGIDNVSYYRLLPDDRRFYINDTGCGNTLNLNHPRVAQMVMDSLRYWVQEMHVDGFRFDLAVSLGREEHGFNPASGLLTSLRQDPVLAKIKLIAEPWDVGPGGYQLGHLPAGMAEWNDRYRDTIRRYWRGDKTMLPELAKRLHGSGDIFEHSGRRPWASINFITSHDGFTLTDLVSYNERHNEANGEGNRDGHPENFSRNYGIEGPTEDRQINALRLQQRRNLLATLLFSQGTPMLLAGDEFGHSQRGNNNAYCQDNETTWIEWSAIGAEEQALQNYVRRLIRLRREHPVLRRTRFLHGSVRAAGSGLHDIQWLAPEGGEISIDQWHNGHCFGLLLAGDAGAYHAADGKPETDDTLLVVFNAQQESVDFTLPVIKNATGWRCLLDSTRVSATEKSALIVCSAKHAVAPFSLVLFQMVLGQAANLQIADNDSDQHPQVRH